MSDQIHIGRQQELQQTSTASAAKTGSIFDRLNAWFVSKSKVKMKEKVVFYRLLATMINAGLSLTKALSILEMQSQNPRMKQICRTLYESVEMGEKLSEGMGKFPDVFADSQRGMILSGESTGKLNTSLLQIADQIESSSKLQGKIKGAMMYPLAIIIVLSLVFIAVNILVIPGLAKTFTQAGAELPKSTQILMNTSEFLVTKHFGVPNWATTVIVVVILVLLLGVWKKTTTGKYYWGHFIFSLPIFGGLARKVVLARFCGSLSTLLNSGISITKAMHISSDVVGNEVYRRRIELIAADIAQGITMEENMKGQERMWPVMLVAMIGVGEQTAQLNHVSGKLAEFYEDEVENIVKNLSSLMEPLIIVLIGAVVGFMVTAIMSPIMQMSEVATS